MSNVSSKTFQTGACRQEFSNDGALHAGWGKQAALPIRNADGLPYVSWTNAPTTNHVEDNQVTGNAFRTSERLVGRFFEGSFEIMNKYTGVNLQLFLNFQFEDAVVPVVLFKGALASGDLAVGDELTDGTNTFIVLDEAPSRDFDGNETSIYVMQGTVAPATQEGTLTNNTSTGDNLVFTSHSGARFRHRFVLDSKGRNLRNFTTAEKTALGGHVVGDDQKSPFATFAKHINNQYDFVYPNTILNGFTLSCSPADLFKLSSQPLAPYQQREPNVIPEAIQIACEAVSLGNVPAHYETVTRLGLYGGALEEYGVTEISLSAEAPVQKLQTTTSGVNLAEPYLEGKYMLSASWTIGRHEKEALQGYRDSNTLMHADYWNVQGWNLHHCIIKQLTLKEAGPNEDEVAAEPLNMSISWDCANTTGDTQNSPIVYDVYDDVPYNTMTGRTSAGVHIDD